MLEEKTASSLLEGAKNIQLTFLRIQPEKLHAFAAWQAKLNKAISAFEGFVSLEIAFTEKVLGGEWIIIQRFASCEALERWRRSQERQELFDELNPWLVQGENAFREEGQSSENIFNEATQVFVTHVDPDRVSAYREWIGKMHEAESKFAGFRRTFVQPPQDLKRGSWITFLQFDTTEHLQQWLDSPIRHELLKEAKSFIRSLESHHVVSGFSGWFANRSNLEAPPAAWKQTMLVLLVLFPLVMLEIRYLSPWTKSLPIAIATFIGNAISVSLVSWPTIPIAIAFLGWWLRPHLFFSKKNLLGLAIVCLLYLLEIAIFYSL